MKRVLRWFRQLVRRERPYAPVRVSGLIFDAEFARASFRPGERVNPLAATIEEA